MRFCVCSCGSWARAPTPCVQTRGPVQQLIFPSTTGSRGLCFDLLKPSGQLCVCILGSVVVVKTVSYFVALSALELDHMNHQRLGLVVYAYNPTDKRIQRSRAGTGEVAHQLRILVAPPRTGIRFPVSTWCNHPVPGDVTPSSALCGHQAHIYM